ncbi:MAG: flavin reductase family protein [Planctomycetota bacterium]
MSAAGDDAARAGIGRAMARLPSGLYVLTAGRGDAATGMLASWVQQIGFEPPTLIVALKKGRPIEQLVRDDGVFCLSVLCQSSKALMGHFARGFEPGEPAFTGLDVAVTASGVPYPRAAHAHLECAVRATALDWSDHTVVCAEVTGGDRRDDDQPLVHVRKNGFSY